VLGIPLLALLTMSLSSGLRWTLWIGVLFLSIGFASGQCGGVSS